MPHSSIVINKRQPTPPGPAIVQTNSLQFDGTFDMATPVVNFDVVGITDTVSWSIWAKNEKPVGALETGLFTITPNYAGGFVPNVFDFKAQSNSDDNMVAGVLNVTPSQAQGATWNNVILGNTDTWVHYVLTFGGASGDTPDGIQLYTQGVSRNPADLHSPDGPSTNTDNARGIQVGKVASSTKLWQGPIYSVAVYNKVLSQADVTAMYNGGNARDFDLENDRGGYTSSVNLIHYFRLGLGSNEADFGTDRVAVGSDLSLLHITGAAPDGTDLTTDIPDGT